MPDETSSDLTTLLGRVARPLRGVIAIVVLAVLIAVAMAALPSGTQTTSLILRGAIGLMMGGLLIAVVRRMLGALAQSPPSGSTVDARRSDIVYECTSCGTRVRLEVAATAKPPRHCGEEMEPTISSQA